jgi:hypothetical protein
MIHGSELLLSVRYVQKEPLEYDNLMLAYEILALDDDDFNFDAGDRIAFGAMNCRGYY